MKNKIIFIFLLLFCTNAIIAQKTPARPFPYSLSLQGTSKPPQIIEEIGEWNDSSAERFTEEGLVLTVAPGDKTAFALDEIPFTSNYGVVVEFEYAMYGGEKYAGAYGDGLSFFIYDSSKKFSIGSHGAGLGYTYRESVNGAGYRTAGLDGAYLGIGFDVFGGYNKQDLTGHEKREGLPSYAHLHDWNRRSITIRGGMHGTNRFKGYPVLYSTTRSKQFKMADGFITESILNYNDGSYTTNSRWGVNEYDIRFSDDKAVFQKVVLTIIPAGTTGTYISIEFHHYDEDFHKYRKKEVLDKFIYPNEFKTLDMDGNSYSFKTAIPEKFKLGFAGSTGGASQVQLVRNVIVSLPYGPYTEDVIIPYCYKQSGNKGTSITVDPFEEAWFYTGTVDNPKGGNGDYEIDKNSFRFEDEYGYPIGSATSYTESGVGTWEYNKSNRTVTFTASNDQLAEGEYTAYFSAQGTGNGGGPFGDSGYRSKPTPITVKVEACEYTILVNPAQSIPVKIKR